LYRPRGIGVLHIEKKIRENESGKFDTHFFSDSAFQIPEECAKKSNCASKSIGILPYQ